MDIRTCVPIFDGAGMCIGVNAGVESWGLAHPQHAVFLAALTEDGQSWEQWLAARDKMRQRESIQAQLSASDAAYARVTDDLIDLLIAKGHITENDLPPMARAKRIARSAWREQLKGLQ